jgi:predicted naringenin-chalcone synthase
MHAAVLGIGTALPTTRIPQEVSVAAARALCAEDPGHDELLASLYRQSGIQNRHVMFNHDEVERIAFGRGSCDSPFVPDAQHPRGPSTGARMRRFEREARPLALAASSMALGDAGTDVSDVTHLVTVSCTGMSAPGIDFDLISDLRINANVERTNIGFMGCHGALNGLRVARAFVRSDPSARVLLCAVELCSLHYYYGWNPKRMVGNVLFSDGAAAVVLGPQPLAKADDWILAGGGAGLFPNSASAMSWHIGDHGFDMNLSAKVPGLIERNLLPWIVSWLASQSLTVRDVASWAIHPGGPRILLSVQEALSLPDESTETSRAILSQYGNMSSTTVLFILRELIRGTAPRPCVALGFGPGLAVEAALFR